MNKHTKKFSVISKINRVGRNMVNGFLTMTTILLAIIIMIPLILTVTNSFMSEREIGYYYTGSPHEAEKMGVMSVEAYSGIKLIPDIVTIDQYYAVLLKKTQYHFLFWNAILVVVPIVFGQIIVASMAAYAFSKIAFRGRNSLFFVYVIVMMMPFQVTLVPNYIIARFFGLIDHYLAIILPGIFGAFGVFLLRQSMVTIPDAYCESAYVDGANQVQIFLKVILPMSKAGIASLAILLFIDNWNMVEQPLIFLQDHTKSMLSVYLSTINAHERGLAFAASSIYMAPMLLVFLYGENYLVGGIALSGLKA